MTKHYCENVSKSVYYYWREHHHQMTVRKLKLLREVMKKPIQCGDYAMRNWLKEPEALSIGAAWLADISIGGAGGSVPLAYLPRSGTAAKQPGQRHGGALCTAARRRKHRESEAKPHIFAGRKRGGRPGQLTRLIEAASAAAAWRKSREACENCHINENLCGVYETQWKLM